MATATAVAKAKTSPLKTSSEMQKVFRQTMAQLLDYRVVPAFIDSPNEITGMAKPRNGRFIYRLVYVPNIHIGETGYWKRPGAGAGMTVKPYLKARGMELPHVTFFEGSESAKRHPWSSLVSPEPAARRWGFRENGKWVTWNQSVVAHASNSLSRSDLVDRFFNRRYMDRFRAIAGVRVKRWAELKAGPTMVCIWPEETGTGVTQFRGLGSLEDCIGLDYVPSPILLKPAEPVGTRKWRSGRLSVKDKQEMIGSAAVQTTIFGTAWQSISKLYTNGIEHEEQLYMAGLVRSDVTAALSGKFCRDGRAFGKDGRRVERPKQWKSGKPMTVTVNSEIVTVSNKKMAGLINLAQKYTRLKARAAMGKEWTQYRESEFVPESVTAVQTGTLVQSLEESLRGKMRKSRGRKLADDVEYAAFGELRLFCPEHKELKNARRFGLVGDYKLACGCVREDSLPVQP